MRKDTIEGKYIGTVVMKSHVTADDPGQWPPDELNGIINGELSRMLQDEFSDTADVIVTKQESWVMDSRDKGGSADGVHKTGQ